MFWLRNKIVLNYALLFRGLQEQNRIELRPCTVGIEVCYYSKTCVKRSLSKRQKISFQDQLLLNAGQKYCRMLQGEHSAILSTSLSYHLSLRRFVLSIFEWPFYTGFYCTER